MARSTKKGPFIDETLLAKVQRVRSLGKREAIKTWSRRSTIVPDFVGMTFEVHNGRKFVSVYISEDMVGHRFGEFALTRTFHAHSGQRKAGVAG